MVSVILVIVKDGLMHEEIGFGNERLGFMLFTSRSKHVRH